MRLAIVEASSGTYVGEWADTTQDAGTISNAFMMMPQQSGGVMPAPIHGLPSLTRITLFGVRSVVWLDDLDDGDRASFDAMRKSVAEVAQQLRARRSGLVLGTNGAMGKPSLVRQ